ncbi:MAG: hypothetical protein PVI92_10405 [Chromatiales bacterium]
MFINPHTCDLCGSGNCRTGHSPPPRNPQGKIHHQAGSAFNAKFVLVEIKRY